MPTERLRPSRHFHSAILYDRCKDFTGHGHSFWVPSWLLEFFHLFSRHRKYPGQNLGLPGFPNAKIRAIGGLQKRGFEDAISGSNPWMYCNGNDNGVGFPRCLLTIFMAGRNHENMGSLYFCFTNRQGKTWSSRSQFLFSHYIGTNNIVHFRDFKRWKTFNETSSDLGSHRYQHFGFLRLLESLIPFWQKNIVFGIQFSNI